MILSPVRDLLDRLRPRLGYPVVVANLVAQIGLVVTGGAVRLTGSGLGCSTWPECEPGQFTPELHAAMSINPLIEFGNRTLTGVMLVISVAVALLVATDRRRPASYRWLAMTPLILVLTQALIGGIIVIFDLNPAFVAIHLLVSMTLVALSTWLMLRVREGDGPSPSRNRSMSQVERATSVMETSRWIPTNAGFRSKMTMIPPSTAWAMTRKNGAVANQR